LRITMTTDFEPDPPRGAEARTAAERAADLAARLHRGDVSLAGLLAAHPAAVVTVDVDGQAPHPAQLTAAAAMTLFGAGRAGLRAWVGVVQVRAAELRSGDLLRLTGGGGRAAAGVARGTYPTWCGVAFAGDHDQLSAHVKQVFGGEVDQIDPWPFPGGLSRAEFASVSSDQFRYAVVYGDRRRQDGPDQLLVGWHENDLLDVQVDVPAGWVGWWGASRA
jgi:hypothetical protein